MTPLNIEKNGEENASFAAARQVTLQTAADDKSERTASSEVDFWSEMRSTKSTKKKQIITKLVCEFLQGVDRKY